jgi:nitrilase
MNNSDLITVGLAQISPVWLDRESTLKKVSRYISKAAKSGCHLIAFGEALVPGYPFWIERTDGARFNSPLQKEIHSHYMNQAIQIEAGHLDPLCKLAENLNISIVLGIIERPQDRGGHSLYCSLVYINQSGEIASVHRKLVPTYEERLAWSPGDGHGLRVHNLYAFRVGGLNCWENWMPLVRAALYAQGEDLHVAIWPGSDRNTQDITRFIAKESRSFVISVSGMMQASDVPSDLLNLSDFFSGSKEIFANGGSCLAAPDGSWIIEPVIDREDLLIAEIDHSRVREERQNFDLAGHYARPDVTQLTINRARQSTLVVKEE